MVIRANREAKKRNPYIKHHFEVEHLTGEERDIIGFLGEFACCEIFGINWKDNIREDYLTIDTGDIKINNLVFDVKTETLPKNYLDKILNGTLNDDMTWGRRLINAGQVALLNHYDIVIFGGFDRKNFSEWHPFGYLQSQYILNNYTVTRDRLDGGTYPFAALPVRTSQLRNINELL